VRLRDADRHAWAALLAAPTTDARGRVALTAVRSAVAAAGAAGVRGHALLAACRAAALPAAAAAAAAAAGLSPADMSADDLVGAVRRLRAAAIVHRFEVDDDTGGALTTGGGALFVLRWRTAPFWVYPYRVVARPPAAEAPLPAPASAATPRPGSRVGRRPRVVEFDHAGGRPLGPLVALDAGPDRPLVAAVRARLVTTLMRLPGASQALVLAALRRTDVPGRAVLAELAALERAGVVRRTCVAVPPPPPPPPPGGGGGGAAARAAARRALAAHLSSPAAGVVALPPEPLDDVDDDVPELTGRGRGVETHYWVSLACVDALPEAVG